MIVILIGQLILFFFVCPVEALLMMARSSVVPGGGASPEFALHVLSECRGDFLVKSYWLSGLL